MSSLLIPVSGDQDFRIVTQDHLWGVVSEALSGVRERLFKVSQDNSFYSLLGQVFEGKDLSGIDTLLAEVSMPWPTIDIRSAAEINGALGAFSETTATIYLSSELLLQQWRTGLKFSLVQSVFLEEFGHYLDSVLGHGDSPGDEGKNFANLVQGVTISEQDLISLKGEVDTATVQIDNRAIVIEQATLSGPSAEEVEMLELINRMRMNPQGELPLLINSTDANVNSALTFFKVDRTVLATQWSLLSPVQPVAWSDQLGLSAATHSELMIQYDDQQHRFPGEPTLGDRILNAGYSYSTVAENIYAYSQSVFHAHAGFAVDWGITATGIQDPPGHRNAMMDAGYREVGLGLVPDSNPGTNVGPLVVTQHFGNRFALGGKAWLLGVTFQDQDGDAFYDAGEGVGGITVSVLNTANAALSYATLSRTAGDYQILLDPGNYQVSFLQGSTLLRTEAVSISPTNPVNVKLDLKSLASAPPSILSLQRWGTQQGGFWDSQRWIVGDFNGDNRADLAKIFSEFGLGSVDAHLSSGSGFAIQRWATQQGGFWDAQKWLSGDFNGDGKTDLVKVFSEDGLGSADVHLSNGAGFAMQRWGTQQGGFWDSQKWLAGDFNGDGKADLLKVFNDVGLGSVDVHLSNGAGFAIQRWGTRQGAFWDAQKWIVGDFNGDGRDDLAKVFNDNGLSSIDVHLSSGTGFAMQRWGTQQGAFWDAQKWIVGDFNGDNRADLAKVFNDNGAATIDVHLSNGSGFAMQRWATQQGSFWDGQKWLAGDFNGNGNDELAKVFGDAGLSSIDLHRLI